jgi:SM-20-related protein
VCVAAERLAGEARPAGMSRGAGLRVDPIERGDALRWLRDADLEGPLAPLGDRFEALRSALAREACLPLARFEAQLAVYPGGGARYVRHRDAHRDGPARRLTAIYYLNRGWRPEHGGALRVHVDGAPLDVEPHLDRLVVFLSDHVEHEVLPAFARRLAITAWYYGADAVTSF